MIGDGFFVPGIQRGFLNVVGERVLVVIGSVEGRGFFLIDCDFAGRSFYLNVSLERCEVRQVG